MRFFTLTLLVALCFLASCRKDDDPSGPSPVNVALARYNLPVDTLFPEGIAYQAKSGHFYTGSVTTGDIYKVDVRDGNVTLFAAGPAQSRAAATGLRIDDRDRLWVCGGASATISVLAPDGNLIQRWDMAALHGARFVNDCASDAEYMYFTDSRVQKIYRAATGATPGEMQEWLSFSDAQIPYVAGGTNANGIVVTPDNRYLLVVVSTSGKLYRIDIATKEIREVALSEPVNAGDGLLLEGTRLFVCRNATNRIYPVAMSGDYLNGTVGAPFGDGLLFNTTMARAGAYLLVVNGQLNQRGTGNQVLPFSVSRISVP